MKNKYKTAGIWNVVCGILCVIVFVVWQNVFSTSWATLMEALEGTKEAGAVILLLLMPVVALYFAWGYVNILPGILMGVTGILMSINKEKGAGTKILMALNIISKLILVVLNASLCFVFIRIPDLGLALGALLMLALLVGIILSVVMDIRAFFQRKEKLQKL